MHVIILTGIPYEIHLLSRSKLKLFIRKMQKFGCFYEFIATLTLHFMGRGISLFFFTQEPSILFLTFWNRQIQEKGDGKVQFYSGTWSPILMKFCIMDSFLVYFLEMLSFWPSNLHGGRSGIPSFQLKKVYETCLCTKTTHCVKLEPQKMQWPLSNG